MRTSEQWLEHFRLNLNEKRVDWTLTPDIKDYELTNIISSLQAWQLGETSEGKNLLHASTLYAKEINDSFYPEAVKLFIKEEQKHGNNLGKYLDLINQPRIKKDWGDSLFRYIRYFNSSMELWTLSVITVESTAQLFYQSLKSATECKLLKQICTDILIDEAAHIDFQFERFLTIYRNKNKASRFFSYRFYKLFYYSTILVVWFAHKKAFKAGGNNFDKYWLKMKLKFNKTIGRFNEKKTITFKYTGHEKNINKFKISAIRVVNSQNSITNHIGSKKKNRIKLFN
ncbi:MAG: hypothetical protein K0S44_1238 [Bacteroidetes bacterium]|jgi:rubrerythrin|nr:hypothetical protein [Bacteroidota bacterium]